MYVGEDVAEEPDFVYIPESHQITTTAGANALEASLVLLQESLESGAALAQFEVSLFSIFGKITEIPIALTSLTPK